MFYGLYLLPSKSLLALGAWLACPLSNPCIGYLLVRTGLVEPAVSKVVENQKEKVLPVSESILYYTLHFIKLRKL